MARPAASRLPTPACRGFTLLELLVALAVFAVVAVMAYGGLQGMLEAREHTRRSALRLGQLQFAVSLLAGDLRQAMARGVRDAYGDALPPLAGELDGVELTRAGHANPVEARRASIQRVRWGVESGALARWSWPVLDRTPASVPATRRLLQGVRALEFEYRVGETWQRHWPPDGDATPSMPRAVRVTLELADWGTVQRLVLLPEAGAVAPGRGGGGGN